MELIQFGSLGYGSIRLAKQHVTKRRLQDLFQIDDIVVVDYEGGEVHTGDDNETYPQLSSSNPYTVVSERDIEESDEEEQKSRPYDISKAKKMQEARRKLIQELYVPLHPHLYKLTEDFFVPSFLEAVKAYHKSGKDPSVLMRILKKETETGIYSFEIFNLEFCRQLIEEVDNFERAGLPVMRPNTMNNYGVILDEIGFKPFFDELTTQYIVPFATHLYPDNGGATLDNHHAFIVQYKMTEDLDLGFHYDESEVTLNVCLGKQFQGGSLYFRGLLLDRSTRDENFEFHHIPGKAILHVGKHRHGANAIVAGERYNLIVWFRSSTLQAAHRHVCHCCGAEHHE
jgi:hypothetical protein